MTDRTHRIANDHLYPTDDLIEHELRGDGCVCGPTADPIKHDDGQVSWLYRHVSARTGKVMQVQEEQG